MNVTLHEEIAAILSDSGNRWMTASEIASLVNERGRYRKKDRTPMETGQVWARICKPRYNHMFERSPAPDRSATRIRLSGP